MNQGEVLNKIFETGIDDDVLADKVRLLEREAHGLAERYCNGRTEEKYYDSQSKSILTRLNKLLHFREKNIPVFVNGDPRGYALKIDSDYVREHELPIHRYWGGYGILYPDE
jgi:hypothetical protein